jgi:hypothetical protein
MQKKGGPPIFLIGVPPYVDRRTALCDQRTAMADSSDQGAPLANRNLGSGA